MVDMFSRERAIHQGWTEVVVPFRSGASPDTEAPPQPEKARPVPTPEDPRYPSHTPPEKNPGPCHPDQLPDDESFPACRR